MAPEGNGSHLYDWSSLIPYNADSALARPKTRSRISSRLYDRPVAFCRRSFSHVNSCGMMRCTCGTHVDEPRAVRSSVTSKRMGLVKDELRYRYVIPKMFFAQRNGRCEDHCSQRASGQRERERERLNNVEPDSGSGDHPAQGPALIGCMQGRGISRELGTVIRHK